MLPETQSIFHRFYNQNISLFRNAAKDFKPIKSHTSEGDYSPYGNFPEMTEMYQLMYSLYLSLEDDLFKTDYEVAFAYPYEAIVKIEQLKDYIEGHMAALTYHKAKYDEPAYPILATYDNYLKTANMLDYVWKSTEISKYRFASNSPIDNGKILEEYINIDRIDELKNIKSELFDLSKLITVCEELNFNWLNNNYYTVGLLLRTIVNIVPPIFNARTFDQVIAELPKSKSYVKTFKHLNDSLREIADSYTHKMITNKDLLPNRQQLDYKSDVDVLICEIIFKLLKSIN